MYLLSQLMDCVPRLLKIFLEICHHLQLSIPGGGGEGEVGEGRKDHQTERLLRKFKEEGRYTNTRTHTHTHMYTHTLTVVPGALDISFSAPSARR